MLHLRPKGNRFLIEPVILPARFSQEECQKITFDIIGLELLNKVSENTVTAFPIALTNNSEWLVEKIADIIEEVNNLYYHFDIKELRAFNLLQYMPDGYMDWHRDISDKDESFMTRKITVTVFLSKPEEYEGGKLIFNMENDHVFKQEQGNVILYPSFLIHKVEPVTKGIRRILIASAHGEPFT